MKPDNVCLECGKAYSTKPVQCMCGWHFTLREVSKNNRDQCQYFTDGTQCEDTGSTTFWTRGKDWFCGYHARKLREESFKR